MEFAERALEAAGIGGWDFDILAGKLTWTNHTFVIHELEPDRHPSLEDAVSFYHPDARPIIAAAVQAAIETGMGWDLELPFTTAKGRHLWVRSCGRSVQEDGKTVRVTGVFQDVTERHELTERAERLSVVVRQMTNAVIITDAEGKTEWINEAFTRLTGYELADIQGKAPGTVLQGPGTDPLTIQHIRGCLAEGRGFEVEILNYTRTGEGYWISITCTPLRDDSGALTGFIAVESDVTARRRAEEQLVREAQERKEAEGLLRDVLEALPSAVVAYDAADNVILTNQAFSEMFPISDDVAVTGRSLEELIRISVSNGEYPDAGQTGAEHDQWVAAYLAEHREFGKPLSLRLPNNRFVQVRERRSDSGILVSVFSDTTDLKRAEAELRTLAERDSVTGLANRFALLATLNRILSSKDSLAQGGVLILFDVDRFKSINDTFGHDIGDALLIEIAKRMRALTRACDLPVRLGGDEFVIVIPGLVDAAHISERMTAIQAALATPVAIDGCRLDVTTSAGVAIFPTDSTSPEGLLKAADLAMYAAKRGGRARWTLFQASRVEALEGAA